MPLDGVLLYGVVKELLILENGRIDKVTQPEPDEIVLTIRANRVNHKLLMTATPNAPRVHFTDVNKLSPMQAPMFTMVLRKHLMGGRILYIKQPMLERIVEIGIESYDEMKDLTSKKLIIEIMGRHSNIILCDENDKVIDAIKHIPPSLSNVRPILPGSVYSLPPDRGKKNPFDYSGHFFSFKEIVTDYKGYVQKALLENFFGISPITASEICLRSGVYADTNTSDISDDAVNKLYDGFTQFMDGLKSVDCNMYSNDDGKPVDISVFNYLYFSEFNSKSYKSPSVMLETFYTTKDESYRTAQKTSDLKKVLQLHLDRCRKKAIMFEKTHNDVSDRDELRVKGELITAYMYQIPQGSKTFDAENYYDENKTVTIELDPELSVQENAQSYYRRYNKKKRTLEALITQEKNNSDETEYLETVLQSIENVADDADITEIRAELAEHGYAKRKHIKNKRESKSKPLSFVSKDGFKIIVGKNNIQNDFITMKQAKQNDMWLHTKDIPGSHVIIVSENNEIPEGTLLEAAAIAAFYSKSRSSSNVPVDYTFKRNVKKISGAKPGFVTYDNQKTLYVNPVEPNA